MSTQVKGGLPVYIGRVPLIYALGGKELETLTNEYSMQFDGVDDYIRAPIAPEINWDTATIRSYSFWFKFRCK